MTYVDPSGFMSMVSAPFVSVALGSLSRISMSATPAIARASIAYTTRALTRSLLKNVGQEGGFSGLGQMSYIYTLARLYARLVANEGSKPDMIPIQVYGSNNLSEHQNHIADSMIGLGSNGKPTPFILHKVGSDVNDRNFLGRKTVCGGYPRADGKHCDEYPYNSSLEGGTQNFNMGNVSVRLVNGDESRSQGRFIRKFYSKSHISNGESFMVIPLGGVSGFFDKKGLWNEY